MDKIIVIYIISSLSNKGPTNILYSIIDQLDRSRFIPIIFTLKPESMDSRLDEFKLLNTRIITSSGRIKARKKLERYLSNRKERVILHSHGIFPDIINRSFLHTKNVVNICTLHDYMFEDYIMTYGKVIGHIMCAIHTWAIKPMYKIACSLTVQNKLNYYNHIQTDAIQNGVKYHYLNLNNEENVVRHLLYLGNISNLKNVQFLIDAFLKSNYPNLILDLVGEGDLLSELREKYSHYRNVNFWGPVNNPTRFLQSTDYLVSASLSEGLPTSVLEALSYGKPLLLSDIGSHKEILRSGNFGFYFKNGNFKSFNEKLKNLLDTNFSSNKIREQAKKRFSDEVMSQNYQKIYVRLHERN
ncbi:glycosyltransferase family 4 protein [Lactiplantibacillus plantarum]|uniref:glycosyltransferase family 4 protein n=1 Tax=Lactiplantibacillus plantarum TaxID=1590 RepID=UPI003F534982